MALFVYLLICVSQLVLRRRLEREDPERLQVRMWLYPYLTYFAIAAIGVVIVSMALVETSVLSSGSGCSSVGVVLVAYCIKQPPPAWSIDAADDPASSGAVLSGSRTAGRPGDGEGRFTRERETAPVER